MRNEKSCGTITINDNQVLLVKQKSGIYGFPKGHINIGETEIEAAQRETKEETNIDVQIISHLRYSISYIIDDEINKEVVYFVAQAKENQELKRQESEIDSVFWAYMEDVINILTFDNLKELWKKAYEDIKKNFM